MRNNPIYIEIGSSYGPFYCDANGMPCAGPDEPGTGIHHPSYGKLIATAMNPPTQGEDVRMDRLVWFNIEEFRKYCEQIGAGDGCDADVGFIDILNVGYLWVDTTGYNHYEEPEASYRDMQFMPDDSREEAIIPGSKVFFVHYRADRPTTVDCGFVDAMNPETGELHLRGWYGAFERGQVHASFAAAMKVYQSGKRAAEALKKKQAGGRKSATE